MRAVTIASLVSVVSLATFVATSSLTGDLWHGADRRNSRYCEPMGPHSLREPINAWSNVAYLVPALLAARAVDVATVVRDRVFFGLLAATLLALSIASFYYHASMERGWNRADSTLTRAVVVVLAGLSVGRRCNPACHAEWVSVAVATVVAVGVSYWGSYIFTFVVAICIISKDR